MYVPVWRSCGQAVARDRHRAPRTDSDDVDMTSSLWRRQQ